MLPMIVRTLLLALIYLLTAGPLGLHATAYAQVGDSGVYAHAANSKARNSGQETEYRRGVTAAASPTRSGAGASDERVQRSPDEPDALGAPDATATRQTFDSTAQQLRLAISLASKDPARASALLETLRPSAAVGDVATLYLARILARKDRNDAEQAVALYRGLLSDERSQAYRLDAAAELAELLLERGKNSEVIALAERYAPARDQSAKGSTAAAKARLCLAAGLASDSAAAAATYFLRARKHAPRSNTAREAASKLSQLRRKHPQLSLHGADALYAEAALLGEEGRLQERKKILELFIKEFRSDPRMIAATVALARVIASLEDAKAAASFLQGEARKASSPQLRARYLYEGGYLLWNGNRDAEALDMLERMLATGSGIVEEQKALYAIGRIHESARRFKEAGRAYQRAAKGVSRSWAGESRWRMAWAAYLDGDKLGAAEAFAAAARSSSPSTADGAPWYWRARALEALGKREDSLALYRKVVEHYPRGYYGWLAGKRLGTVIEAAQAAGPGQRALTSAQQPGPLWKRARILAEAGLDELAAADLRLALARLGDSTRRDMLPLLAELGAFDDALRTAAALYKRGLISREQLNHHLYPPAYKTTVEQEAHKHGLDPLLLQALMRQESAFDPAAVSPAGATGLMQLMEATARRIGPLAGLEHVERKLLFDPETNIKLGAAYLGLLSKLFEGKRVLMLAAYNAGEKAAARWRDFARGLDDEELVEQISYRETRDYVKKVSRNLAIYKSLYGSGDSQDKASAIRRGNPPKAPLDMHTTTSPASISGIKRSSIRSGPAALQASTPCFVSSATRSVVESISVFFSGSFSLENTSLRATLSAADKASA